MTSVCLSCSLAGETCLLRCDPVKGEGARGLGCFHAREQRLLLWMSGGSDVVGARMAVMMNFQMRGLYPKACVSWMRCHDVDRGSTIESIVYLI
jgi:hypothetical protein